MWCHIVKHLALNSNQPLSVSFDSACRAGEIKRFLCSEFFLPTLFSRLRVYPIGKYTLKIFVARKYLISNVARKRILFAFVQLRGSYKRQRKVIHTR